MRIKKLLVTGVSGFLGWNICSAVKSEWDICGTVFSHSLDIKGVKIVQIDLTDFNKVKDLFKAVLPNAVINTAAATSPNYCQSNQLKTKKINIEAAANIAGLCSDLKIPYAFTSTDLVFDGHHPPYKESDPVSPVNIYGEQKVLAEERVLRTYPDAAVCRMPLMFGIPSPAYDTFFQQMINSFRTGREVRLFSDEFRTPVSGHTASQGLMLALEKVQGLIHLGGRERISRYDFGELLADVMGAQDAKLIKLYQQDVEMPAPRAADVSLDSSKSFSLGYNPPILRDSLQVLVKHLLTTQ